MITLRSIERAALTPGRISRLAPSLYAVAAIAVLGGIFVVGLAPRLDTDLWWHLLSGVYIASHGTAPVTDPYSFTMAGHAWTDHEWLTQLAMYAAYTMGGVWTVTILFAALVTVAFGLVYLRMLDLGVQRLGAAFVLLAGFAAASPILGARPQMVTLLMMATFGLLTTRYVATGRRRWLFPLPPLMLVWANAHGGFCLGLLYLGLIVAGESLNIVTHRRPPDDWNRVRAVVLTLVVCVAVTALNPYGWRLLLYPFELLTPNAFTNSLNEWSSVDFHMPQMMVFEALMLLLVAAYAVTRPRLDWADLALTLVFTHLALSGARNVAVWVVLITPTLAATVQGAAKSLHSGAGARARRRRQASVAARNALNVGFLVVVLVLYAVLARQYTGAAALASSEGDVFPEAAVAYIRTHHLPRRVFSPYAWGGYVIWKLPGYRDFIDGRANTVFDAVTLRDYLAAYGAAPSWRSVLRSHQVDDVLLDRSAPLAQAIALDRAWREVYRDRLSVVFVPTRASG